ncbi:hypothetical protein BP6252_14118 [Coleophoma cylindrospora]|uniref:DUF7908 domain-containing protein n=1 Tax=Coleophoma cylindrospora TaxID=1849047 RepID=A0A3D8Q4B5_9HELO|nr:hypothetical protein BP6252_14118 [Coleophoma cylindrospora]
MARLTLLSFLWAPLVTTLVQAGQFYNDGLCAGRQNITALAVQPFLVQFPIAIHDFFVSNTIINIDFFGAYTITGPSVFISTTITGTSTSTSTLTITTTTTTTLPANPAATSAISPRPSGSSITSGFATSSTRLSPTSPTTSAPTASATSTDGELNILVQIVSNGKRQTNAYRFLNLDGSLTESCLNARKYFLRGTHLLDAARNEYIAANPGDLEAQFLGSNGSIATTFLSAAGEVVWRNESFSGGVARFFYDTSQNLVQAVLSSAVDTTLLTPVRLFFTSAPSSLVISNATTITSKLLNSSTTSSTTANTLDTTLLSLTNTSKISSFPSTSFMTSLNPMSTTNSTFFSSGLTTIPSSATSSSSNSFTSVKKSISSNNTTTRLSVITSLSSSTDQTTSGATPTVPISSNNTSSALTSTATEGATPVTSPTSRFSVVIASFPVFV